MAKAEISWKRKTEEGQSFQVYAHHVGNRWTFYIREGRYDSWQIQAQPPLEDWLSLLDGIRRRVARRLLRPEEADRVRNQILERFPEAEVE